MGVWKKRWLALLIAAALSLGASALASNDAAEETAPLRLPIVMYHHISPEPSLWGTYVLSVEEFESDLQYLRQAGYESITISQLLRWAAGEGQLPEKPCMITLDDGYETSGVYAAPLLEKYGYTGVLAVIGSVADQYSLSPDHNALYSYLNWEALAQLQAQGVLDIQYHSWDLHRLEPREGCNKRRWEDRDSYAQVLRADVERFRSACVEHGVTPPFAVAYPFGAYCRETLEIMEELGFQLGFTCTERVNRLTGEKRQLLELGRFNRPHGVSSWEFFRRWES